jgi:hypothetical protein
MAQKLSKIYIYEGAKKETFISKLFLKQNTSVATHEQHLIDPKYYFPTHVTKQIYCFIMKVCDFSAASPERQKVIHIYIVL